MVEARKSLYGNLTAAGLPSGETVVEAISEVIRKYIKAFNLAGLQDKLTKHLKK